MTTCFFQKSDILAFLSWVVQWIRKWTLQLNKHLTRCRQCKVFYNSWEKKKTKLKHSQMIAMRELKLPILKHSRATSMKNSMTRARCFFFTGCMVNKEKQCLSCKDKISTQKVRRISCLVRTRHSKKDNPSLGLGEKYTCKLYSSSDVIVLCNYLPLWKAPLLNLHR